MLLSSSSMSLPVIIPLTIDDMMLSCSGFGSATARGAIAAGGSKSMSMYCVPSQRQSVVRSTGVEGNDDFKQISRVMNPIAP